MTMMSRLMANTWKTRAFLFSKNVQNFEGFLILWIHILIKRFYRVALGSIKSKNSYLLQELRNRLLKSVTKYVTLASWPGRAGSCLESIQNWKRVRKCVIQNCSKTNIKDFIAFFGVAIWLRRKLSSLAINIVVHKMRGRGNGPLQPSPSPLKRGIKPMRKRFFRFLVF